MKKLMTLIGIVALGALLIVPAIVWAQGWGYGPGHMRGNWDRGAGPYGGGYDQLTPEQRERLVDLDRKFFDETRELRNQLWSKRAELDAALAQTNPDPGKVQSIQKEVSDLRAKMDEKKINHQLEARKIAPDNFSGGRYGSGRGMRGGYGRGPGMMRGPGAGYGPCWN